MENKLLIIQELSGLRKKGKFEEIVDLCTENLKSDPDNLFLLRAKAHAAYEIGRIPAFSVVLTCIEKILEQSPNDIESLILQVRTLRRLNRIDEAKISLELAERIESDNPDLLVQNDAEVSFVTDGKFYSSNGNLASYISSLELLEKMTSKEQRLFVESYLYLDRLKDWDFNEQK